MYCSNDDTCILSPAPDTPNFLSRYLMPERTDYAEQTFGVNAIDDQVINATRRVVCYNQPIYDDGRLEVSEYAGLTLDVVQHVTTVLTEVQDLYDFVSIRILDDDSECNSEYAGLILGVDESITITLHQCMNFLLSKFLMMTVLSCQWDDMGQRRYTLHEEKKWCHFNFSF